MSAWLKTSWQTEAAKSFDIYGCKNQNLKVDSVVTAYPANSRKTFCEVCNNAIIAKHSELEKHNW